ncbi:septum formation initiator family protein [Candidatus Dependentiae bacterium]|nr:septum formation initiator family protein [Candidatus Dependentiae bacterium]
MTFLIRKMIIFFLLFEVGVFFVIYCFGPKSIKTLHDIYFQKKVMQNEIIFLSQENKKLTGLIEYHKSEFAKEKIAREVLKMKKPHEKIYFLKN